MRVPGGFAWIDEREESLLFEVNSGTANKVSSPAPMRSGRNRFTIRVETIKASMPIESTHFKEETLSRHRALARPVANSAE